MKPQRSITFVLALGVFLSACANFAIGQIPVAPPVKDPGFPEIRVQKSGAVKVLVYLKGNYRPEGQLNKAGVAKQRQAINAAQARVIKAIRADISYKRKPGISVYLKRRYVTLPGLALEMKPALLEGLKRLPDVAAVYEDRLDRLMLDTTTAIIGSKLANTPIFGVTGRGETVAVLDTGIDRNHLFLGTDRFVANACFSSSSIFNDDEESLCPNGENTQFGGRSGENCQDMDGCEHGTHVAGIIGGLSDGDGNGVIDTYDFYGVAPRVRFIAMQVFHAINDADFCASGIRPLPAPCIGSNRSDLDAAMDRVQLISDDRDIAAVNLSMGHGEFTSTCDLDDLLMTFAINNLRSRDTATVAASGNDGFRDAMGSPACVSSAISVGNSTRGDSVASDSNHASFLSLLAPGNNVCSAIPGDGAVPTSGTPCGSDVGRDFTTFGGTSMAAPHVAGAWALMRQHRRERGENISVTSILNRLRSTGLGITASGITVPRIDVMTALDLKAVEIVAVGIPAIRTYDGEPVTIPVILKRTNFTGEFNLRSNITGGQAGDLTVSLIEDPPGNNRVLMTVDPSIAAIGYYNVEVSGSASGVGVFPKTFMVIAAPPPPVVSGFSPDHGPPTTVVTITGQNFSRITEVRFNGSPASTSVISSTSLRATVPLAARSGVIEVRNAGHVVETSIFTVTAEPVITSVAPDFAPAGAGVVVNGANFDSSTRVRINNIDVTNLSVTSSGQLSFNVPQITPAGVYDLRVNTSVGSDTTDFHVGYPPPTISGSNPQNNGYKGGTITLYGTGFYAPVMVGICSTKSTSTILSPNSIRVNVPLNIENTCAVTIMTPGGIASMTMSFLGT